jgi:hypothetical protein
LLGLVRDGSHHGPSFGDGDCMTVAAIVIVAVATGCGSCCCGGGVGRGCDSAMTATPAVLVVEKRVFARLS